MFLGIMLLSLENGFSIIMGFSYFSAFFSTHQSTFSMYFETRNMPQREERDEELSRVDIGNFLGGQTQSQTPFALAKRLHSCKMDASINCCVRQIFLGKGKKGLQAQLPANVFSSPTAISLRESCLTNSPVNIKQC